LLHTTPNRLNEIADNLVEGKNNINMDYWSNGDYTSEKQRPLLAATILTAINDFDTSIIDQYPVSPKVNSIRNNSEQLVWKYED